MSRVERMELAVVVVNWNGGACLGRLLESLAPLREELGALLVVDNDSKDGSPEAVLAHPGVRLLAPGRNLGFAGGANRGIEAADAGFILLLNPDVEVSPEAVRRLYREIRERPQVALACPALRDPSGASQRAFQLRPLPTPARVAAELLFLDDLFRLLRRPEPEETREWIQVEQPAAACWLLRREAWEEVGGFDTRFHPAWFEDVDFCKRLAGRGWQVLYFPRLAMIHHGGLSLEHLSRRRFQSFYYRNLLRYLAKHHRRSYPLLWPLVQVGHAARRLLRPR